MFSYARTILPVLMLVCLFSFIIRGLEVWSGVKSMTGSAYAVEGDNTSDSMNSEENIQASTDDTLSNLEENNIGEPPIVIEDSITKIGDDFTSSQEPDDLEFSGIRAELTDDLVMQRERLETLEQELIQKEALLKAAEQELDRKYDELSLLRQDIEELLVTQSEEEEGRIVSLVKIYENMKPKQAAEIFNTLDLDILVEVISRMSERKVSPIMAALNPERARTITIMLAEQKQLPKLPM